MVFKWGCFYIISNIILYFWRECQMSFTWSALMITASESDWCHERIKETSFDTGLFEKWSYPLFLFKNLEVLLLNCTPSWIASSGCLKKRKLPNLNLVWLLSKSSFVLFCFPLQHIFVYVSVFVLCSYFFRNFKEKNLWISLLFTGAEFLLATSFSTLMLLWFLLYLHLLCL